MEKKIRREHEQNVKEGRSTEMLWIIREADYLSVEH